MYLKFRYKKRVHRMQVIYIGVHVALSINTAKSKKKMLAKLIVH